MGRMGCLPKRKGGLGCKKPFQLFFEWWSGSAAPLYTYSYTKVTHYLSLLRNNVAGENDWLPTK